MIYVLSLDGGGVLGLISLRILYHVEQETGRSIASLFSMIGGVSAGGLLALGLTKPDASGKNPAYSAEQLLACYGQIASRIFQKNFLGKLCQHFSLTQQLHSLFAPKYSSKGAASLCTSLFEDTRLSQALTPVLISAYNIASQEPKLKLFSSYKIRGSPYGTAFQGDFWMREVALATCAVPTYFAPQRIHRATSSGQWIQAPYHLIDGGVAMNDMSLVTYVQAQTLYPQSPIFLLSLGSGQEGYQEVMRCAAPGVLAWWAKIGQLISGPQLSAYRKILRHLMRQNPHGSSYLRIQPSSHFSFSRFDNTTLDYLLYLEKVAFATIKASKDSLTVLIRNLRGG